MLRARNDALTLALKHIILSAPEGRTIVEKITQRLRDTANHALFSSAPSDAYLHAFDAAIQTIEKWSQPPRPGA